MKYKFQVQIGFLVLASITALPAVAGETATSVNQGKRMYAKLNCASCHSVHGSGGCMGPDLSVASRNRSTRYLILRLSQGREDEFIKEMGHPELFPHPRFASSDVKALLAYIGSLAARPASVLSKGHGDLHKAAQESKPAGIQKVLEPSPASREGRRLFLEVGCLACHSVGGAGGDTGPALDGIGGRRSRQFIQAHITDPQAAVKHETGKRRAKSGMIQGDLYDNEVQAITNFLLTLPPK